MSKARSATIKGGLCGICKTRGWKESGLYVDS